MSDAQDYTMRLSLSVLNHLGLNLYSNMPAVLSEVVANSWDADAENVRITVDRDAKRIVIEDDGHGMTRAEVGAKYLEVGYMRRRTKGEAVTPKWKRPVMGRKGIGKLSLLSIARTIEVHTVRNGEKSAFQMLLGDIEKAIRTHKGEYHPKPLAPSRVKLTRGTKIILSNLKRGLSQTTRSLRKRLARRFSIIGEKHRFLIEVDGEPVTPLDRDYFHKVQYLWRYGDDDDEYLGLCKCQEHEEARPNGIRVRTTGYEVRGGIGTAAESGALKDGQDNLNRIVLMVRGKLAHEDILEDLTERGLYTKYLIGEIEADFLDLDAKDDIATTSRQRIVEDDPRYVALKKFIFSELRHIKSQWTDLRNKEGADKACETIPAIRDWLGRFRGDTRRRAQALLGKINTYATDSEQDRNALFKYSVLAFESLRCKDNLDALDRVEAENLPALTEIFRDQDDVEAAMYYQIVQERLGIIEAMRTKVGENALERVVQQYLFDHLWLLDPSWERVEATEHMEESVAKEFGKADASLTKDERLARLDIRYRTTSGKHVIIELKRADVVTETFALLSQIRKYIDALRKCLDAVGKELQPIEAVCVVGKPLSDWASRDGKAKSAATMAVHGARVVRYEELLENASEAYKAFSAKRREAGRIWDLVQSIDTGELFGKR